MYIDCIIIRFFIQRPRNDSYNQLRCEPEDNLAGRERGGEWYNEISGDGGGWGLFTGREGSCVSAGKAANSVSGRGQYLCREFHDPYAFFFGRRVDCPPVSLQLERTRTELSKIPARVVNDLIPFDLSIRCWLYNLPINARGGKRLIIFYCMYTHICISRIKLQ